MKPIERDIRRGGRRWSHEEFDQRLYQAPEKIEFVNGIFASEQERFNVLRLYYVAKMFTPARRIPLLGFSSVVRSSPPFDWVSEFPPLDSEYDRLPDSGLRVCATARLKGAISWPLKPEQARDGREPGIDLGRILVATGAVGRSGQSSKSLKVGLC